MSDRSRQVELLQGTLDMLILESLLSGPRHGYAVARWIQTTSGEALAIEEGSLYPALHRMERRGWIEAEWGLSESNRKAKFYRLTAVGRSQLREQVHSWDSLVNAISLVLKANSTNAADSRGATS